MAFWKKKKKVELQQQTNPYSAGEFVNVFEYLSNDKMISTHEGPDAVFTYVNHVCRDILGWEPEELIGTSAYEYHHPDDTDSIRQNHDWVLKGEDVNKQSAYRFRCKDGGYALVTTISWLTKENIICVTYPEDQEGSDVMATVIATMKKTTPEVK